MFKPSKRTLAILLTAVAVGLLCGGLTLAEKGGKGKGGGGGGGGEAAPPGPGLIALNDSGWIVIMNPDGSDQTPVAATDSAGRKFGIHSRKPAWSPMFSDGNVKLAYPETLHSAHLPSIIAEFPRPDNSATVLLGR